MLLKYLISCLLRSKIFRTNSYIKALARIISQCLNDQSIRTGLKRHPSIVLESFSELNCKEIAHNYLEETESFIKSPSTWIEFRKRDDYAEIICRLNDLKPLLGTKTFDTRIVMSSYFEEHFLIVLNCQKSLLNHKNSSIFAESIKSLQVELLRNRSSESYFLTNDS